MRAAPRADRTLLTAASLLLAFLIAVDFVPVRLNHPAATVAVTAAEPQPVAIAFSGPGPGHRGSADGTEDCQLLRPRPAPVTAPVTTGRPGCVDRCADGAPQPAAAAAAPVTGRQAVPLSRSGELPVAHQVFRC